VLARRWTLDPFLAEDLVSLDRKAAVEFAAAGLRWPGLWIISGFRSRSTQAHLNPAAPDSLHTRCPSMAADLRVGNVQASITTREIWAWLGAHWQLMGNRWGGAFSQPDENHFDLGLG